MTKSSKPCVVSPSLLARVNSIDTTKKVPEEFKLGMSEWTDSDNEKENDDFQPPKKRMKVPGSLKGKQRFTEMVSSEQLETISKRFVPKNTEKNTKWAVSTFKQWIVSGNQCSSVSETIDVDILSKPVDKDSECTELCRVLCLFVVEARKTNVEPYPPKTVFHLLAGLLRYARSGSVQQYPNFLDPKDVRFRKLQGTMDTHFRKLRQAGVGAEVKHSGTISPHEEDLFWELGNLGTSTPLALLRSVFYYNGKVLCLHGGDEHRQLKFSQLKRVSKGYIYTENGSGGVAQMKIENKVVPSYTSTNAEDKE